jgi:hypothetical protein
MTGCLYNPARSTPCIAAVHRSLQLHLRAGCGAQNRAPQDDKTHMSPHQCVILDARNLLRLTVSQSSVFTC